MNARSSFATPRSAPACSPEGCAREPDGRLTAVLSALTPPAELDATRARTEALLASGTHPEPSGEWPAIPWPPV